MRISHSFLSDKDNDGSDARKKAQSEEHKEGRICKSPVVVKHEVGLKISRNIQRHDDNAGQKSPASSNEANHLQKITYLIFLQHFRKHDFDPACQEKKQRNRHHNELESIVDGAQECKHALLT